MCEITFAKSVLIGLLIAEFMIGLVLVKILWHQIKELYEQS